MPETTSTWKASPFSINPHLSKLPTPFPTPEQLWDVLCNGGREEREVIVRLWLSEGVPFSFRKCPAIFEDLRGWLGNKLDVHAKEITLIGSGRIGFSLASGTNYGKVFDDKSDLDFSVISSPLFHLLSQSFSRFVDDFRSGRVLPSTGKEAELWPENVKVCRRNIRRGFLDSNKIPDHRYYPVVKKVSTAMWYLQKRLAETPEAPSVKYTSVRVYRCWQSFVDQVSLNLFYTIEDEKEKTTTHLISGVENGSSE